MVIDGHVYVGESIQGYGQSVESLLATMAEAGIDRAVICPVKPRTYDLWPENERVASLAQRYPEQLIPFARVDPRLGDRALAELERALGDLGLRGLLLHPFEETFRVTDPRVDPLIASAGDRGVPVIVETGFPWLSEAPQVGNLARRFPQVQVIMTRGGQINISGLGQRNAWQVLSDCPNVSLHTSGVYREDFIEEVIEHFGPERVIFGSSAPIMDARFEVLRVTMAHVSSERKEKVLGENMRRMLNW
jgi:predicted TIM-barrel fold metal-dependent hydrolase